jgi:hypothetical protein
VRSARRVPGAIRRDRFHQLSRGLPARPRERRRTPNATSNSTSGTSNRLRSTIESDRNALVYDVAWWEQPIAGQAPYVSEILVAHAERLLDELERSKRTRGDTSGKR